MTDQPRGLVASAAAVTAPAPLVRANGVTLQYKTPEHLVTATYRVSFDIFPGERYVILGPSGCGKSTILKAIAGFLKPVEGEFLLKGKPIREPGPDRLMVFQEFDQLLPWKTVKQNVMFALTASGKLSGKAAEDDGPCPRSRLTHFWIDVEVHPNSRARSDGLRPALANSTICCRNSAG